MSNILDAMNTRGCPSSKISDAIIIFLLLFALSLFSLSFNKTTVFWYYLRLELQSISSLCPKYWTHKTIALYLQMHGVQYCRHCINMAFILCSNEDSAFITNTK